MAKSSHGLRVFFLIFFISYGASSPAFAQKESCKKCEFAKCIKNAIKQKEALRAGYEELAKKWDKIWVNADAQPATPLSQIDMESLDASSRIPTFAELKTHFIILRNQEEEMASRVGAPQGCGYDPSHNYEMVTDSIFCQIDMAKAHEAEEAAPCKELYEIAFRHEAMHLQRCLARKGNKALPTTVLTPAGKAREEAAAYAQEIAELKKLLEDMGGNSVDIEGSNEMNLPSPIGTIVINLTGKIKFTVSEDEQQTVTGSGDYSVSADTSRSQCRISGYNQTYPLTLAGNRSGDTFHFKVIPAGTQVIPSFRITCAKGWGFSFPVPRMASEQTIAAKDGEQIVIDVSALTQGHVKGKNTFTLHLCKEEK